jgi:methylase of polypeptide subunit release factors
MLLSWIFLEISENQNISLKRVLPFKTKTFSSFFFLRDFVEKVFAKLFEEKKKIFVVWFFAAT